MAARTCDKCGSRMSPRWPRTRVGNELWCPMCAQNAPRVQARVVVRVREVLETLPDNASQSRKLARLVADDQPPMFSISMTKLAHDSGDGETIFHCPFCGSGQVVARSDGTINCEFCNHSFTVQIQPEFSAFPQTINGVPVQVPGMPPSSAQPMQDGDPQDDDFAAEGGDADGDGVGDDEEGAVPTGGPPMADGGGTSSDSEDESGDDGDDDDDSGDVPAFLKKKKSYRTHTGAELDQQHYMQYLALRHIGSSALDTVKRENAR